MSKTTKLLRSMRSRPQIKTPIATDMFIPNHSGITVHPEFRHRKRSWNFTIINPNAVFAQDDHVFIAHVFGAIEILEIHVELDTAANQIDADLIHTPNFIATPAGTIINSMDTTAGTLETSTITSPDVADGKHISMRFNTEPSASIGQCHVTIFWRNTD